MPYTIPSREPRVISMQNQSGGSIKTSSATVLAALAAEAGLRVRLWDLDPQANASGILGWMSQPGTQRDYLPDNTSVFDVIKHKMHPKEVTRQARYRVGEGWADEAFEEIPNLSVVLGSVLMGDAEYEIPQHPRGAMWLRDAIDDSQETDPVDVHILDAPPTVGRVNASLLVAATEVLACVVLGKKELDAALELEHSLAQVRESFRRVPTVTPTLTGIIVGRAPLAKGQQTLARNARSGEKRALDSLMEQYNDLVLPMVRQDGAVPDQYEYETVLPILDPKSKALGDYRLIAAAMGLSSSR